MTDYILENRVNIYHIIFITLVILGTVVGLRIVVHKVSYKRYCMIKYFAFFVYICCYLYLTFGYRMGIPVDSKVNVNLISNYRGRLEIIAHAFEMLKSGGFIYIGRAIADVFGCCKGAILNILLFIPMGYFVPCILFQKNRGNWMFYIIVYVIIIFLTEIGQYSFNLGWFDLDDVINNLIGSIIGFVFYKKLLYGIENSYLSMTSSV